MPYQPATLKGFRTSYDVEDIGVDAAVTGPGRIAVLGTGITWNWNISLLGVVQWVSTIWMLATMVILKANIDDIHTQIHGGDDTVTPIFQEMKDGLARLRTDIEKVEFTDDKKVKHLGLKALELYTVRELQHIRGVTTATRNMLSHLDDSAEKQQVDLAAFIEHHADDVECADCRENIFEYLVGKESRYEDDGLNDCGQYYCVAQATPFVDPSTGCTNDGFWYYDTAESCFNNETSVVCTDGAFVPAAFTANGTAANCPTACDYTAPITCADEVQDADGACAGDCRAVADVVYNDDKCRSDNEFPTTNATLAAEAGACHANCLAYNRAGSEAVCFNSTSEFGSTPEIQFKAYLTAKCADTYETCQMFDEDHYRKDSVCEASEVATPFAAAIAALGDDGTTKIVGGLLKGTRAACKVLKFCD